MAGIKNWFVRSERVKDKHTGLIKYAKYLNDRTHTNHSKTDNILPIIGNIENVINVISREAIGLDMANSKKGGRPVQSYAQSFVFGLPPGVNKPTPDQWKAITRDVIVEIAKKLGVSLADLKGGRVFANVHDQENPHLNLIISRVVQGQALKALDQKGVIGVAKKAFTAATLAHCGIDAAQYEPLQTNLGRRQAKWKLQEQRAEKAVLLAANKTKELDSEIKKSQILSELTAELNNKIIDWIFAVKADDYLSELTTQSDISEIASNFEIIEVSQEQAGLVNRLFETAEEKTGKTLSNRVRYTR